LLPGTDAQNAFIAAERLRKDFAKMVFSPSPGMEVQLSVSIGVSRYIPDEQPSTFLKRVDEAMYKAKKQGKNRVLLAPCCREEQWRLCDAAGNTGTE
jgi:diguanylate cyclase (GGDEF)-like protein